MSGMVRDAARHDGPIVHYQAGVTSRGGRW